MIKNIGNNIKVSACIITYNQEKYIRECLEGAIMQEVDFGYEVVIGDDCSTDGTSEICAEYAAKYPNLVRYHRRDKNLGMHGNVLQTFQECDGEFIAICEGDDCWQDKYKLKIQLMTMESNRGVVLTYHQSEKLSSHGEKLGLLLGEGYCRNYTATELVTGPWIPTQTMFFRNIKDILKPTPSDLVNLDLILTSLLGSYGYAMFIDEIRPSAYRYHDNGVWSSQTEDAKFSMQLSALFFLKDYWKKKDFALSSLIVDRIINTQKKYLNYLYSSRSRVDYFKYGKGSLWSILKTDMRIYIIRLTISKLVKG